MSETKDIMPDAKPFTPLSLALHTGDDLSDQAFITVGGKVYTELQQAVWDGKAEVMVWFYFDIPSYDLSYFIRLNGGRKRIIGKYDRVVISGVTGDITDDNSLVISHDAMKLSSLRVALGWKIPGDQIVQPKKDGHWLALDMRLNGPYHFVEDNTLVLLRGTSREALFYTKQYNVALKRQDELLDEGEKNVTFINISSRRDTQYDDVFTLRRVW